MLKKQKINLFLWQINSKLMLNKVLLILLGFIALSPIKHSIASNVNETKGSNWEVVSEENGVQVMERWVTNEKNLKVKERTGRMTLNCSMDEVIALISDANRTQLWMSNAEEVKVLKTVNKNEWYVHTVLDAPWPFNKQDMVSKYQVVNDPKKEIVSIIIEKDEKLLPPQKNMDRLDTFSAEWTIEQVKENKVRVTFTTKSTQPPKYPTWAQDPVVRRVFSTNLKNFKALINKA